MPESQVPELTPRQVREAIQAQADKPLLLDCRTPEEHQAAKIQDTLLLPMQELPGRVGELEPHRERRIVVLCHHGQRSQRVAAFLQQEGYDASSMTGGIDAWSRQIDPEVPRY